MAIAVTGPLASGKSTFVEALGDLGVETISADEIVHQLLASDRETIDAVVRRFGEGVRAQEGGIDRKALGRKGVIASAGARGDGAARGCLRSGALRG